MDDTQNDQRLFFYYAVLAVAAILVLVWYFFIYPNRNLPAKLPIMKIAPSREVLNRYSAPGTVSKKVPDAVAKKYTAPKSAKPVEPPSQNIINSFSASSEI